MSELYQDIAVEGLQNLNDQLTDAIVNSKSLGDAFKNVAKSIIADLVRIAIQQAIIKPLADSLGGGEGGGGGFASILSSVGSIFGRASGGPVSAGQVYRVNEGTKPEFFRPSAGGDIIPLSKMNAVPAGGNAGGGMSVIRLELSGDIQATMKSIAQDTSIEVTRQAAPAIQQAAVAETFRRGARPGFG